jgi:RimJ/RimL family protein N-acetyltransferase
MADVSDLVDGLNNLSVAKWLAFVPHPYTDKDALKWVEHCTNLSRRSADRIEYEFGVELKSERRIIGGVSLTRISRLHGTAGGGIWLNARYQGHGYGSEAFSEKIRFAFEDLNLRRLDNGFFRGNSASLAMQQRFGYRLEEKSGRCTGVWRMGSSKTSASPACSETSGGRDNKSLSRKVRAAELCRSNATTHEDAPAVARARSTRRDEDTATR